MTNEGRSASEGRQRLTDRQAQRVVDLVVARLRRETLPAPREGEAEPAFTARVLQPVVAEELERIGIGGLVNAGDGAAPVASVSVLALQFFPDITVSHYGERLLAIEVKYLTAAGRQGAFASAVGQASLYRQAGYRLAAVLVVDLVNRIEPGDVAASADALRATQGVSLIVRRRSAGTLLQHV